MRQRRRTLRILTAVATFAFTSLVGAPFAQAQSDYPNKAIRLIVGYAPGGPTDVIARLIGQDISASLGQAVVIENRSGANGNIATEAVARSPADGYTLVVNTLSHNVNALLQPDKVKYDPVKDFAPVGLAVVLPQVLVVAASSPYQSIADLVAKARTKPDAVSYGSAGIGGSAHLAAALLADRSKTQMTHVPFRGNAPALTEVMSGRVDFMFYPMIGVSDFVTGGKLRILGITTKARTPDFPKVPTMAEAGYPGFEQYVGPVGFLAPAGTPPAVLDKLDKAISAAIAKPANEERLKALGAVVMHLGPADYRDWLKQDHDRWAQLIHDANIKAE